MRLNTGRLLNGYVAKTRERRQRFLVALLRATPVAALFVTLGLAAQAQDTAGRAVEPILPVTAVTSGNPGPTVAFVAGVHGGKVAAIRALDLLRQRLSGHLVRGRVLLVSPANLAGYTAGLAQISPDDSLNLNRVFPGRADGRRTERLAAKIMRDIVAQSDYLVDLHGSDGDEAVGRFAYAARPGLTPRVDSAAKALAEAWGTAVIVWDEAGPRTLAESRFLQTAAHLSGVPAITVFEAGATREDAAATAAFIAGAERALRALGMLDGEPARSVAPLLLARRAVVTAQTDGAWRPATTPGVRLAPGEPAGWLRSSSGVEVAVPVPDGGLVLHLRKAGPLRAGTPLVITGISPTP